MWQAVCSTRPHWPERGESDFCSLRDAAWQVSVVWPEVRQGSPDHASQNHLVAARFVTTARLSLWHVLSLQHVLSRTSLVTERVGIAARFVTLASKRAVVTKRAATHLSLNHVPCYTDCFREVRLLPHNLSDGASSCRVQVCYRNLSKLFPIPQSSRFSFRSD